MRLATILAFGTCWHAACAQQPTSPQTKTPLDDYVAKLDPTFAWKIVDTKSAGDHTLIVVDLTSQTWRSAEEVDRPTWKHWLLIAIPTGTTADTAMLFINGGSHRDEQPQQIDGRFLQVAMATKSVVAELKGVPNQPLSLRGQDQGRYEDDLLAASWNEFMKTKDPTWLAQLPMTKSAVAAMDAVEQVLAQAAKQGQVADAPQVSQFVVAGASKRGWTSWLTAAVDPRVVGVVPVVIDVLNIQPSMKHHHASLGFWSEALEDYERQGLADRLDDDESSAIRAIVDPYVYRERLTMPKCSINASQDEFFLPDSSRFYFDDLVGEKHLSYTPNTGHGLKDSDALDTLVAFHHTVVHGLPRPTISWSGEYTDAEHRVACSMAPVEAVLWRAENPEARDFRFPVTGPAYQKTVLEPQEDGTYVIPVAAPEKGWSATFARFGFDVGAPRLFRVTTPVWIAPDTEPFAE